MEIPTWGWGEESPASQLCCFNPGGNVCNSCSNECFNVFLTCIRNLPRIASTALHHVLNKRANHDVMS